MYGLMILKLGDLKMIKEFNRITLEAVRKQLQNNLKDSLENIIVNVGNCSYDPTNATFKLELRIEGADTKEFSDLKWVIDSGLYDLDLDRYHPQYKLVGYKARSRKRPFIIEDRNEKRYVIDRDQAMSMFGAFKKKEGTND
mgnify:FL=1